MIVPRTSTSKSRRKLPPLDAQSRISFPAKAIRRPMASIHLRNHTTIKLMCRKSTAIVSETALDSLDRGTRCISDAEVELAPSDNPNTSTFFQTILRTFVNEMELSFIRVRSSILVDPPKDASPQQLTSSPGSKAIPVVPGDGKSDWPNLKPGGPAQKMSGSVSPVRSRQEPKDTRPANPAIHKLQKHTNSCSTIYVDDSTVSQPNCKAMITCVSYAIHSHTLHRKSNKTMNIFDEKLHPLTVRSSIPMRVHLC